MFDQEALLEYLRSPEGINKIIVGIILVGAINAIFITYSVRTTYGAAKKERDKDTAIVEVRFFHEKKRYIAQRTFFEKKR